MSDEQRLVFVVGCPRSGTTFTGSALGSLPGFVDLDEVTPLKAALPRLAGLPEEEAARELRAIVERVRLLGLARGLRGVEQTPETSFVVRAALRAYPSAVAVHVLRDGRDVVCSLLERGWFRAAHGGSDDAGHAYGAQPRFWVEPERREEFSQVSEARRAAWAWRRYVEAARAGATVEVRYESLQGASGDLARALGVGDAEVVRALADFHAESIGRWRDDLSAEQLADVEAETGSLLRELGYTVET
jgi:DNA-binding transcriptional ArsR family regulator